MNWYTTYNADFDTGRVSIFLVDIVVCTCTPMCFSSKNKGQVNINLRKISHYNGMLYVFENERLQDDSHLCVSKLFYSFFVFLNLVALAKNAYPIFRQIIPIQIVIAEAPDIFYHFCLAFIFLRNSYSISRYFWVLTWTYYTFCAKNYNVTNIKKQSGSISGDRYLKVQRVPNWIYLKTTSHPTM